MGTLIGIDVGGTFTDLIALDEAGAVAVLKTPSTPDAPAEGVVRGITELAGGPDRLCGFLHSVDLIVHGTTITTNAVITRRYARTGYLTTRGFKDILNSRRGIKRRAFTAKESPPEPIVPQHLVRTAGGRIGPAGEELEPLDEADIRAAAVHFRVVGVEAIAVNLMFSFLNAVHEERAAAILAEELPLAYVSLSSRVLPYVRMYERGSTTVFNACVGPLIRAYIDDLRGRLAASGFRGRLLTIQSNGGVMSPEVVKDYGANTLLSGPASGPVAAVGFAEQHGLADLITIDMGGTSLDACLVRGGRPSISKASEVAEYALAVPSVDIRAIGAGGGSIARLDLGGVLRVGPMSAGAVPGPAAYGFGGEEPTVTDANLVLGYLDPGYFLGGARPLRADLSEQAIAARIARALGVTVEAAAAGIVKLIDAQMADGVRAVSIERGFDPRDAALVVAGGAGPLHGCGIAEELALDLVLVPKAASVLCATGMLVSDLRHDFMRFAGVRLEPTEECVARLNMLRTEMIERGRAVLDAEGVAADRYRFEFAGDMMFEGQFNVLETLLPTLGERDFRPDDVADLVERFGAHHEDVYGYRLPGVPVEIQSLRLVAEAAGNPPRFVEIATGTGDPAGAIKRERAAWFDGEARRTTVYAGDLLRAGDRIDGPAIVEEPTTTVLVRPGWQLEVDPIGSYLMHPAERPLADVLARLSRRRPHGQGTEANG